MELILKKGLYFPFILAKMVCIRKKLNLEGFTDLLTYNVFVLEEKTDYQC